MSATEKDTRERRLRELRRRFLDEAAGDQAELLRLLAGAAPGLPGGEDGRRFQKLAHDLKGSGGSYGFPAVSAAAGALEEAFVRPRPTSPGEAAAALDALARALARAVEALA